MLGALRPNLRQLTLSGNCTLPRDVSGGSSLCSSLQLLRKSLLTSSGNGNGQQQRPPCTSRNVTAGATAAAGGAPLSTVVPVAEAGSGSAGVLAQLEQQLGPISRSGTVLPPQPIVIVISGPSGVGKDAVLRRLEELRPDLFFVVTATSRAMRPREVDGVDYIFVNKERFEQWIEEGELLEHAVVYGEYKGIPRQQVLEALNRGTDVVLRIDVQGAATVRRLLPGIVTIFLVAESEAELAQRLVARKTEEFDKMLLRVQTARRELEKVNEFDYVVVNRDGQLDETVRQLSCIIDAEKSRTHRRVLPSTPAPATAAAGADGSGTQQQ